MGSFGRLCFLRMTAFSGHLSTSGATRSRLVRNATRSASIIPFDIFSNIPIAEKEPVLIFSL